MTQKSFRSATLGGSGQTENFDFAGEQIGFLNTKAAHNLQAPRLISYVVDGQLNVIHLQFSHSPSREIAP